MSTPEHRHPQLRNQPPDPHPRAPRSAPPAGSWDCHIHLFGPHREYPFDAASPYVSDDALPEDYLQMQSVLGIQHAVIVSAGGYGANTRHIESVLGRFGDRFRGIILPPANLNEVEILRLRELGVRGVRMFAGPPNHEWSHLPGLDSRIAALVHEYGWHVQYQSLQRGHLVEVADQLLAFPNPVVLDHFGAFDASAGVDSPAFRTVLRMLDSGKTWVKMSGPMRCSDEDFPYPSLTAFARRLLRHAPERLLWGSDWPHVQMNGRSMPNDGDLIDLFEHWVGDPVARQRILATNPLTLYH